MESDLEYIQSDAGLKIYFSCPEMDLREIGLVSTTIHQIVNKVAKKI